MKYYSNLHRVDSGLNGLILKHRYYIFGLNFTRVDSEIMRVMVHVAVHYVWPDSSWKRKDSYLTQYDIALLTLMHKLKVGRR